MFSKLVASAGSHKAWTIRTVSLSVAAHLLVLALLVVTTRNTEEAAPSPPKPEEVTYVDVSQIPEPPEPEPEPEPRAEEAKPEPTPAPPRAAPRQPRVRPPTPNVNEVAGTQELKTPPKIVGIPSPDVVAPPVKAEDFGGRGAIGGTAAGVSPPTPPATMTGTGSGSGSAPEGGTYSSNMVDQRAELINRSEIARRLQRLYPPMLRDAQVTGSVSVQFVVMPNGRVDMNTAKVLTASHAVFSEVTLQILKDLRFKPARVGDTNVRMLTVMPVKWTLER